MKKLELKHVRAISMITQGVSGRDIAEELEITQQTLIEWKKEPLFMSNVNRIKMEVLDNARTALQNATELAVLTLQDIMENSTNDEIRRKASGDILRIAGFEPKMNENYAWGIGATDYTSMQHELDGSARLRKLLGDY